MQISKAVEHALRQFAQVVVGQVESLHISEALEVPGLQRIDAGVAQHEFSKTGQVGFGDLGAVYEVGVEAGEPET